MKPYNLLLLDADGTIFDFERAEEKALQFAFDAMDVPATKEQFALYSETNRALWRAFERKEVTQKELRILRFSRFLEAVGIARDAKQMGEQFEWALGRQTQEIDGAFEMMREAASRVPIIVVTNGLTSVQRTRFSLSQLGQYISGLVISGEMGFAKPDPRMIERAIEISGLLDANPLMLGDEPASDIAAANAAGIDSCWFNRTRRENPTPNRPTYEIHTLKEVLQWV